MGKFVDLTGRQFGRLTVLGISHRDIHGHIQWKCQCSCGGTKNIAGLSLKKGASTSCGCFQKENVQTYNKPKWEKHIDVQGDDDCWEYRGRRNQRGYGVSGCGLVHRAMYEKHVGPIPEKAMVLHKCDNPACCNPAHLFLGDNAANMADMKAKGRGRSRPGEHNGNAKLTMEQAREIRSTYPENNFTQLAKKYGVTPRVISLIVRGKSYREDADMPATLGGTF